MAYLKKYLQIYIQKDKYLSLFKIYHAKQFNKKFECSTIKIFCEKDSKFVLCGDVFNIDKFTVIIVTNEMHLDVNMFCL